jgi:phosphoribosylformylglycinamidine cyclo-ligase
MTYAGTGVDIDEKEEAIKQLLSSITTKRKGTMGRPMGGHYAGLIEFGEYALVLCTDGVGTKVKIAEALKKWDTVGIDCIAMNVNDALCVGAEPLAFVDYLAMDDPNPKITREIGKGLAKGAALSNISIVGGETADLPEIINLPCVREEKQDYSGKQNSTRRCHHRVEQQRDSFQWIHTRSKSRRTSRILVHRQIS